jgi:phosphoribosylglycinamide formyltransferase-1
MNKVGVAVLASGEGTNAAAIIEYERHTSDCPYTVVCIVSNKTDAGVLQVAALYGVPSFVVSFNNRDETDIASEVLLHLGECDAEFICLAGFLRKIPLKLLTVFHDKIINIHPSLLPSYGGKGMYGRHVFQAVLDAKEKVTGVTIHAVSADYDEGAVIFRETIAIDEDETVNSLAEKTRKVEHRVYPEVLASECRRIRRISMI